MRQSPRPPTPAWRRWEVWAWTSGGIAVALISYYMIVGLTAGEPAPGSSPPPVVISNVEGQGAPGGEVGWHFSAGRTEMSTDGTITTYHDVKAATFYKDGRPRYQMTATQIVVNNHTLNYDASGLHIWSVDPKGPVQELWTARASWSTPLQTLTCTSPVRVKYRGTMMYASRLETNFQTGATRLGRTRIQMKS